MRSEFAREHLIFARQVFDRIDYYARPIGLASSRLF